MFLYQTCKVAAEEEEVSGTDSSKDGRPAGEFGTTCTRFRILTN